MSSRSKEKVTAALRKFFKSSKDKEQETTNEESGAAALPVAASDAAKNINAAATGGPAAVSGASKIINASATAGTDSPGKRPRRQDNKVSPAASKIPKNSGTLSADSNIRVRRLMKEYREMQKLQSSKNNPTFTVELVKDNLFEWHARLFVVDPDSRLAQDMIELNIPCIVLHLVFPENFPFTPPFMRVVEPRIEKGYVMEGGAICMELLTPRGWASAYTVEALLMQFSASVVKGQGRILRKPKSTKEFNRRAAEESFRSLVKTHDKYGWVTPALSDG